MHPPSNQKSQTPNHPCFSPEGEVDDCSSIRPVECLIGLKWRAILPCETALPSNLKGFKSAHTHTKKPRAKLEAFGFCELA